MPGIERTFLTKTLKRRIHSLRRFVLNRVIRHQSSLQRRCSFPIGANLITSRLGRANTHTGEGSSLQQKLEFSNGCTSEFAAALETGIPTLDSEGNPLEPVAAVASVGQAVEQLGKDGL